LITVDEQEALSFAIELAVGQGINILDRSIQLFGDVDEAMLKRLDTGMSVLEKVGDGPITVKIESDGGDLYPGFAIAGRIRSSPCEVITEALGNCMSVAFLIFAAGDVRRARSPVVFMVHQIISELPAGKLTSIKASVAQINREHTAFVQFLSEMTGTDESVWTELVNRAEDTYLTVDKAFDLNLVTEVC